MRRVGPPAGTGKCGDRLRSVDLVRRRWNAMSGFTHGWRKARKIKGSTDRQKRVRNAFRWMLSFRQWRPSVACRLGCEFHGCIRLRVGSRIAAREDRSLQGSWMHLASFPPPTRGNTRTIRLGCAEDRERTTMIRFGGGPSSGGGRPAGSYCTSIVTGPVDVFDGSREASCRLSTLSSSSTSLMVLVPWLLSAISFLPRSTSALARWLSVIFPAS